MSTAHSTHDEHHDGDGHGDGHDDGAVHAHISDWKFLIAIFSALIVLTFITVGVSYVDLGQANTVVAVVVATVKASLVATFFMHLRHDKLFNTVIFLMAFVFLGVFLGLTRDDLSTRGAVDDVNSLHYYRGEQAGGSAPGNPGAVATHATAPAHGGGGGHGAAPASSGAGEHGGSAPAGGHGAESGGGHGAAPASSGAGEHGGSAPTGSGHGAGESGGGAHH